MTDRETAAELIDIYGGAATEKQLSYLTSYYIDDLSYYEIAQNEGISPTGVRDVIVRGLHKLQSLENSLGFAALIREIKEAALNREPASRILEIIENR